MQERSLRRFFDALISLSFVSPLALLGGCEGGPGSSPPLIALPSCPSPLWCDDASRFRPAAGIDYVELRAFTDSPAKDAGCVVSSVGTRCAGATDAEGCLRTLSALAPTPTPLSGGASFPGGLFGLAATAGDRIAGYPANREALPALGPIDSEQEAVLIVRGDSYRVDCGLPMEQSVRPIAGGYEIIAQRGSACGPGDDIYRYTLLVGADGSITEQKKELFQMTDPKCVIGRRPDGLCAEDAPHAPTVLGQHFASVARLEAASVPAFLILRAELAAHGAPRSLLRSCERAARDEVRHTRITRRLARRFGGKPAPARIEPRPLRALSAVARENEVEGCVRETFGALVGQWQAERAADAAIRAAMIGIAADELRHAALSWRVRGWAHHDLGRTSRAQLREEQRRAVRALREELQQEPPALLVRAAGLPRAAEALALADRMERELWSAASA